MILREGWREKMKDWNKTRICALLRVSTRELFISMQFLLNNSNCYGTNFAELSSPLRPLHHRAAHTAERR
jgi:hypothetical protein